MGGESEDLHLVTSIFRSLTPWSATGRQLDLTLSSTMGWQELYVGLRMTWRLGWEAQAGNERRFLCIRFRLVQITTETTKNWTILFLLKITHMHYGRLKRFCWWGQPYVSTTWGGLSQRTGCWRSYAMTCTLGLTSWFK